MTFPPIIELIPHRSPMLLLERVLSFENDRVVCGACPKHTSIFAREGVIPGVALLEYMAQATAVCLALGRPGDRSPRARGLLVSARHFSLACPQIACDTELVVAARLTVTAGPAANFECSVDSAEAVDAAEASLASAELTVYLPSQSS